MKRFITAIATVSLTMMQAAADRVAHLSMDLVSGTVLTESVGGATLDVYGLHEPENVAGAVGNAWRLDGYSSFASGDIGVRGQATPGAMTFSVWVAPETYPVVKIDQATDDKVLLAGTIDDSQRAGWAFRLGNTGKYSFECYSGGWKVTVDASDAMPCYQWSHLVAVVDGSTRKATLYRNGTPVGETRCMNTVSNAATVLRVGKSADSNYVDAFLINTFNGLVDDIDIYDTALSAVEIAGFRPEREADLSIPESRFADDLLRPAFHGMPAAAWTNECHGMAYSNGRYHLFFQKNANGPYMTRLHWGHISSENLYDWREERIAIAPGESYDIKGCWSGCVFTDPVITAGRPAAIYTAVDYARAVIASAAPADDDLIGWNKQSVIINGRPSGLSDDFRDPYFFRNGDNAYIIVGSSRGGVGTTTLHRYNASTGVWSNDGTAFFTGASAGQAGSFWEMPNITPMDGGKWLFTVTPIGTTTGVHTLYWTGSVNTDGTFSPDYATPRQVELISRDGYGMLSPTVFNHDGKTIALGIVPDKLSGADNAGLGWAHTYSLPREWTVDADGNLWQRPYAGLKAMRSSTAYSATGIAVSGTMELAPVSGRRIELLGRFDLGTSAVGFNLFKNANGCASISYNPSTGQLTVDASTLRRKVNDSGVYNGVYSCSLPERLGAGQQLLLNVFADGSILDIFVNNRWATSIRLFPTDADADGVEVFASSGSVNVPELHAWVLDAGAVSSGIDDVAADDDVDGVVDVWSPSGVCLRHAVPASAALDGLGRGMYIVGHKKVFVD